MQSVLLQITLWPVLVYVGLTLFIITIMMLLSWLLGQKHSESATNEPYESGVEVTGTARLRFSSQFYLVAMFFVIFDLEAVFIIAWALAFNQLGWVGFGTIGIFIFILGVVLIYEWKTGALDFGPDNKKILKAYKKITQTKSKQMKV